MVNPQSSPRAAESPDALPDDERRRLAELLRRRGRHIVRRLDAGLKAVMGEGRRRLPAFRYLSSVLSQLTANTPLNDPVKLSELSRGLDESLVESILAFNIMRTILAEESAVALGRTPDGKEMLALSAAVGAAGRGEVASRIRDSIDKIQQRTAAKSEWLDTLTHRIHGNLNAVLMMLEVLKNDLGPGQEFADCVQDIDVLNRCIVETVELLDQSVTAATLAIIPPRP